MKLEEALKTGRKIKRNKPDAVEYQWFQPNTGPFKHLVDCDYFVIYEDGHMTFSTSIDLYASCLFADDYIFCED